MRHHIENPGQNLVETTLTSPTQGEKRRSPLTRLAIGALLMIAPALMGAEGCELADLGGNGSSCGGLAGPQCKSDEFCDYPSSAQCGAADQTGTCQAKPEECADIYKPVCGCDDKTYGNECEAHGAGVSVAKSGACKSEPDPGDGDCGGIAGLECKKDEFCNFPAATRCGSGDQMGSCEALPEACDLIYSPVCGCDGKTYGNECAAHIEGVSVASQGECDSNSDDSCGGIAGLSCEKGEFCNYPVETKCGSGDQMGSCEAVPEVCADIYSPVCGCDDKTYSNECEAHGAGVSVASEGECDVDPGGRACGGLAGVSCGTQAFCNYPKDAACGAADQMGTCELIPEACDDNYAPVCGCDDNTYSNECEAHSAGVSVASEGTCEGATLCGGLGGERCEEGEFCNMPGYQLCGLTDGNGFCMAKPEGCTKQYEPVCGCDNQTYGNQCEAHSAGISVLKDGPCDEGKVCSGLVGSLCDKGEFCSFPPEAMCGAGDQTGLCAKMPEACTEQYDPVCGCDGKTYGNACSAASAGMSVASDGECATK